MLTFRLPYKNMSSLQHSIQLSVQNQTSVYVIMSSIWELGCKLCMVSKSLQLFHHHNVTKSLFQYKYTFQCLVEYIDTLVI